MVILFKLVIGLLSVLGLAMTLIGLPGNTFLLLLTAVYAWYGGFSYFSLEQLAFVAVIYLAGEAWEFAVGYLGIKKEKVSWWAVLFIGLGTVAGAIIGTSILPVVGSIIGASAGAFITAFGYEYFCGSGHERAMRVAIVAARNQFLALIGKLIAGVSILVILLRSLIFSVLS